MQTVPWNVNKTDRKPIIVLVKSALQKSTENNIIKRDYSCVKDE